MALSYKVFPGTPYYSNTALTTQAGTIVNTTAATYVNTTYGTVSVGGSTYYVAYGQMISFWNSSFTGQEIDDAVSKVRNPDTAPTEDSTNLVTSGGVKTALTKVETGLAEIHATGTTNATGATIKKGVFFYLNGTLVQALVNIADGATFTENTNYKTVTAGGLNDVGGLNRPIEINSNTDLNTLETPGAYFSQNSSVTNTLQNCPASYGFSLLVLPRGSTLNNGAVQLITDTLGTMYSRAKNSGGWETWTKYAKATEVAEKGNTQRIVAYAASPNGKLVINLPIVPNSLIGLLVLSTYSTTPPKSSIYNVLVTAPSYNSRFATIVENLNINAGVAYNQTDKTLTVTFNSTATYMQAEFYTVVS